MIQRDFKTLNMTIQNNQPRVLLKIEELKFILKLYEINKPASIII